MRKPIKPLPTDCCGSGCPKCIYDIYAEHLKKYKEWKKEQQENPNKNSND